MVYRGLSTETLLVTEQGYIQLTDFRFAKTLSDRTYTVCGHPEYMAPEMVSCVGHTDAVDLWALGVLIYSMLTKGTPFAAPGAPKTETIWIVSPQQIDIFWVLTPKTRNLRW